MELFQKRTGDAFFIVAQDEAPGIGEIHQGKQADLHQQDQPAATGQQVEQDCRQRHRQHFQGDGGGHLPIGGDI